MIPVRIVEYNPGYQPGINQMMAGIEKEFPVPITGPQYTKIYEVYKFPDHKFWVALHGDKVVGTIGLTLFSNGVAILKRMMVAKDYRGKDSIVNGFNTAALLLNESLNWAKEKGFKQVSLGTMDQFKAAQSFYVKNGFREIKKEGLPAEYTSNPIDTLFYSKDI